jgi:rubrerythrin
MTTLIPTPETGATTQPTDMIYTRADVTTTDQMLAEQIAVDGVNGAFLADVLSAVVTHERCGVHLYRSVAGRALNPALREKFEEFGNETLEHVEIAEGLIETLGGNPSYVSPMARAVEATNARILESTFLLTGSLDVLTAEMVLLDAVLLAEAADHTNWTVMGELVPALPEGSARDAAQRAVDRVMDQEDEHLEWARRAKSSLVKLQATEPFVTKVGASAEELADRVRAWTL